VQCLCKKIIPVLHLLDFRFILLFRHYPEEYQSSPVGEGESAAWVECFVAILFLHPLGDLTRYTRRKIMALVLSGLGILVGLVGTLMFMLIAFVPKIGIRPLVHAMLWKTGLALLAVTLTGVGYWLQPTSGYLAALIVTGLLGILTYVAYPPRVFRTLTWPRHLDAPTAELGDRAPIIGFAADGQACAWPMELVVPRHLVQDRVGNIPVLVAY